MVFNDTDKSTLKERYERKIMYREKYQLSHLYCHNYLLPPASSTRSKTYCGSVSFSFDQRVTSKTLTALDCQIKFQ